MKQLIIFLLLVNVQNFVQAQNTETDSLKRLLLVMKEGPERVLVLEGLSYAYVSAYPDTALQYASEGLLLAQKINDRKGEAYCTNALGNVYFGVGDYPQALEMYLSSLKMKEQMKNQERGIAVSYFNIANVYTEQEEYRQALYYLFKSKYVDEKMKDSASILFDLHSLSSIYLRMKITDSALHYVQKAVQLAERLQDKNMIGAIVNNLGEIHAYLNNFSLAAKYYHLSINHVNAINDNEVLASDYYGLAKIFEKQGLFDSSAFYAHKSLSVAREAPFLKQLLEASSFLAGLYKAKNKFDSAFYFQEISVAAKDSLYNVEKVKKVQNLKLLEQQRQQAIEVAQIKYQGKLRFYAVLFASAIFLLIALFLWRNNKQKHKAYLLLQQQKLKTEEALNELNSTQAQLLHKEKMASLGELTAGIAHEIQNPLNFVNNFAEINVELLEELKDHRQKASADNQAENEIYASLKQNLEKINFHGKRADAIVKNMLAHSRVSKHSKEPTDINALVAEHLNLSFHSIRAKDKSLHVDIQTHFDSNIEKINVIKQDIGRLLLNLFTNAFYAVSLLKSLKKEKHRPLISVTTKRLSSLSSGEHLDGVEITVTDNGNGIPSNIIDKIFHPFFTTKPTGEGTGLGLSLAYDIIKAHNGTIQVESKEGEGSKFIIVLPS